MTDEQMTNNELAELVIKALEGIVALDATLEILSCVQAQMADRLLGLAHGVEHLTDETQRAIDHFVWGERGEPAAADADR
ncbi:MAG: hypothetical protein QM747_15125 [Nocardioides sp.]